jgi:hypothetical protein
VARVRRWCAARLPEHTRRQVRIECDTAPRHLTIVERRAPWHTDLGPEWTTFPIVRLRYTATGCGRCTGTTATSASITTIRWPRPPRSTTSPPRSTATPPRSSGADRRRPSPRSRRRCGDSCRDDDRHNRFRLHRKSVDIRRSRRFLTERARRDSNPQPSDPYRIDRRRIGHPRRRLAAIRGPTGGPRSSCVADPPRLCRCSGIASPRCARTCTWTGSTCTTAA